jgi:recA bacterial DNA recombination protein
LNLNNSSGIDPWVSTGVSLGGLAAHLVPARELEAREKRGRLGTGIGELDRMLGGGWPRGAVSELWGARGQGRTAALLASLAAALRREETVALVDLGGTFDPWTARRVGVPLERLLWVRTSDRTIDVGPPQRRPSRRALAAAEAIVAAGGFGLVVLDFGEVSPAVPSAAWLRLRRLVAAPGTVLLVVSPRPLQGVMSAAAVTLGIAQVHFQRSGRDGPALLTGVRARVRVDAHGASEATNDGTDDPSLDLVHAL